MSWPFFIYRWNNTTNRTSIYRDEQEIPVNWDALKNGPAYLDRSGRWRSVPDHELRQYQFRPEWLLPFISFQFGISTTVKPRLFLEGVAWELGQTHLGKQRISVLFARRLDQTDHQDTLSALLKSQRRREDVVVLSSAPIRDRIDVLTSKGFIKFNKDGAARSRNGFLCVEGMERRKSKPKLGWCRRVGIQRLCIH